MFIFPLIVFNFISDDSVDSSEEMLAFLSYFALAISEDNKTNKRAVINNIFLILTPSAFRNREEYKKLTQRLNQFFSSLLHVLCFVNAPADNRMPAVPCCFCT